MCIRDSDIVVERFVSQSPKDLLIAPDWGLKNYEFVARLQKRMKERDAYQGKNYKDSEKRIIFADDKFTTWWISVWGISGGEQGLFNVT